MFCGVIFGKYGPSILAFNDAQFKESDWDGIRMIYDSVKQSNPLKIGRFGLGFKSVFHMTDLPCILSGRFIAMIDPHEDLFTVDRRRNSTFMWELEASKDTMLAIADQWKPFNNQMFYIEDPLESVKEYPYTLFRFPLRTESMTSQISQTVYADEKVLALFQHIEQEGHNDLLFLNSIESVKLCEKNESKCEVSFELKIASDCLSVASEKRNLLKKHIKESEEEFHITYPLTLERVWYQNADVERKETVRYIVTQMYCDDLETKKLSEITKNIPLVGVAVPIGSSSDEIENKGGMFCFLPLPHDQRTGLEFHVNACFTVDQNRRGIQWPSEENSNAEELANAEDKSKWNCHIRNNLLPKVATRLAEDIVQMAKKSDIISSNDVYKLIPDEKLLDDKWKPFAEPLMELLQKKTIFHVQDDTWVNSGEAIFCVSPEDCSTVQTTAVKIMRRAGRKMVHVPRQIHAILNERWINKITNLAAGNVLQAALEVKDSLTDEEKIELLAYFVVESEHYDMGELELIPFMDGSWRSMDHTPSFISTDDHPASLLPGLEHMFVSLDKLHPATAAKLQDAALKDTIGVKMFTSDHFSTHFSSVAHSEQNPQWHSGLWVYLTRHFSANLSAFHGLPILRTGQGLCRLHPLEPLIEKDSAENSPLHSQEGLLQAFSAIGIREVSDIQEEIKCHPQIRKYIFHDTMKGLLDALKAYLLKPCVLGHTDSSMRKSLCAFLGIAINPNVDVAFTKALLDLPLFQTNKRRFISMKTTGIGYESVSCPISIEAELIDLSVNENQKLAQKLDINHLNNGEVFCRYFFNSIDKYSVGQIEEVALDCLTHLDSYKDIEGIVDHLKRLPFVPTGSARVTPCKVVDPNERDSVSRLCEGLGICPIGKFSKPNYRDALRELGMRTKKNMTEQEVMKITTNIQSLSVSNPNLARSYAEMLLEWFEHHQFEHDHLLWQAVQDIPWLPIEKRPKEYPQNLKWFGEGKFVSSPSESRSVGAAMICGSSAPCVKTDLQLKEPSFEEGLEHFRNCIAYYNSHERHLFCRIALEMYSFIQSSHVRRVDDVLGLHNMKKWIWNGEGFSEPSCMTFDATEQDFKPYVYKVPAEMKDYKRLLQMVGVNEKINCGEILNMLNRKYESGRPISKNDQTRDLVIAVAVLETFCNTLEDISMESYQDLPIPVENNDDGCLRFFPASRCFYCDRGWVEEGMNEDDLKDENGEAVFIIHSRVPTPLRSRLKIKSLTTVLAQGEDMSLQDVESFGQNEPLTQRLNRLLVDYPAGLPIIKELLQNADDANATEVSITYDERQNESSRVFLLDDEMNQLQGPAIWAYNNAVFKKEDFKNIVNLSGATKKNNTEKIGCFGLGFNAVYNWTDVPSFVSEENIVYFDPHKKFLKKVLREQPGIKLSLKSKSCQLFRHQFEPYDGIEGCNLAKDKKFNGTLFRFPLRTEEQAACSEISESCYTRKKVKNLFQSLYQERSRILLFTQNVQKLTVYHIPAKGTPENKSLLFSITKERRKTIQSFNIDPSTLHGEHGDLQLRAETNVLKAGKMAMEGVLSGNISKLEVDTCSDVNPNSFLQISTRCNEKESWLITSCVGQGEILDLSRKNKLSPVGGVSIKLANQGVEAEGQCNGKLFCFLPLPIPSVHLPVHLNGCFAVTADRKQLCTSNDDQQDNEQAYWNEILIKEAIVPAYVECISEVTGQLKNNKESIYKLWPLELCQDGSIQNIVQTCFFRSIISSNIKVFPSENGWMDFAHCCFLESSFRTSDIGSAAQEALEKLLGRVHPGHYAVDPPEQVTQLLQTYCEGRSFMSRTKFYETIVLPLHAEIENDLYDKLLCNALLQNKDSNLKNLLKTTNCIPVEGNCRHFVTADKLIHPDCTLAALYSEEDGRFPCIGLSLPTKELSSIYDCLEELGMACNADHTSWEEICIRALTVPEIDTPIAEERSKALFSILNSKLEQNPMTEQERERLSTIAFIKVKPRPDEYPLDWWSDANDNWSSPESIMPISVQHLVSSSAPIIDDILYSGKLCQQKLGILQKKPSPVQLEAQIECLMQSDPNTGGTKYKFIQDIFHLLCGHLDTLAKLNSSEGIFKRLRKSKWILHEDGFISPHRCAEREDCINSCPPYLFNLPHSFIQYESLRKALDMKEFFQSDDIVNILREIKVSDEDLAKNSLDAVIVLSTRLDAALRRENKTYKDVQKVYIPSSQGRLRWSTELAQDVKSCPWLVIDPDIPLVHSNIPFPVADILGVKTLKKQTLTKYRRRLGQSFGQKEKLSIRIKKILESYPFSKEILHELLQNADDSGASTMRIVFDNQQHSKKRIFDECWEDMQGPALLIYNDKPFTKTDLEGIQALGEGSKSDDPAKTGQFGVGFNCVYHVTDAPTFITKGKEVGHVLCAFDPLCCNVPEADDEDPGYLYEKVGELQDKFPDVFECYHPDIFDQEEATLFRLPLRKKKSEIGSAVTQDKMQEILKRFVDEMSQSLLFLKNVTSIQVSVIDENGKHLSLGKATSNVIEEMSENSKGQFLNNINEKAQLRKLMPHLLHTTVDETAYKLRITTCGPSSSNEKLENWIIVQRHGFLKNVNIPAELERAFKQKEMNLLPLAGIAYNTTGDADDGKLFCFLPLPIPSYTPVHINAHFALETENRRHLWLDESHEKPSYRMIWNEMLMCHVVAPAYVLLLKLVKSFVHTEGTTDETMRGISKHHAVFPVLRQSEHHQHYQEVLVKEVYHHVVECSAAVFPSVKENEQDKTCVVTWHSAMKVNDKQPLFNILPKENTPLKKHLNQSGMSILESPSFIYENLKSNNPRKDIREVCPKEVICYFKNTQLAAQGLGRLPNKIENTPLKCAKAVKQIINYIMGELRKQKHALIGLPLLVTVDNRLRVFPQSKCIINSQFADLIPEAKHEFIHSVLLNRFDDSWPSIKIFDLVDFERLLPLHLCAKTYKNKEVPLQQLLDYDDQWLYRCWEFFSTLGSPFNINGSDLSRYIGDWALFPATNGIQNILVPLKKHQFVLRHMRHPWNKLNVWFPWNTPSSEVSRDWNCLSTDLGLVDNVVHAVDRALHDSPDSVRHLNEIDKQAIQDFFESQESIQCTRQSCFVVSNLPIFTSIAGVRFAAQALWVHVVPKDIPDEDMDGWKKTVDNVFMHDDDKQKHLYRLLPRCDQWNIDRLYCNFIFNQFEEMTILGQRTHLTYLRNKMEEMEEVRNSKGKFSHCRNVFIPSQNLIDSLRKLHFLKVDDENLPACEFYDGDIPLFRAIVPQNRFPPRPYDKAAWKEFLKKIGLVDRVTPQLFIRFAKEVEEREWEENSNRALKSKALLEHLFKENDLYEPKISSIQFVVPYMVQDPMHQLAEQYNRRSDGYQPYISLRNTVLEKHEHLVWTQHNLLPNTLCPRFLTRCAAAREQELLSKFGVITEVSGKVIFNHLKTLCVEAFDRTSAEDQDEFWQKKMMTELGYIYDALTNILDQKKTEIDLLEFGNSDIILCNGKLVKATQLVIENIEYCETIPPYLYKMHWMLEKHKKFLLSIGAAPSLTAQSYHGVLKQILMETHNRLSEEHWSCAVKAYSGLLKEIIKNQSSASDFGELYLPGHDHKLHPSQDLVYVDDYGLRDRVGEGFERPFLIHHGITDRRINEMEVFEALQPALRPCALTSIVCEVPHELTILTDHTDALIEKLRDKEFAIALKRMLLRNKTSVDPNTEKECNAIIQKIVGVKIYRCNCLKTSLSYNGKIIKGSVVPKSVFHQTKDGKSEIYIDGIEVVGASFYYDLARCLFPDLDLDLHIVTELLQIPSQGMQSFLDDNNIPLLPGQKRLNALCGSFVPITYHCFLDQRRINRNIGEIVALETHDPMKENLGGRASYIFGQLVKQASEDKIEVYVGDKQGVVVVDIDQVYAFQPYRKSHDDYLKDWMCEIPDDLNMNLALRLLLHFNMGSECEEQICLLETIVSKMFVLEGQNQLLNLVADRAKKYLIEKRKFLESTVIHEVIEDDPLHLWLPKYRELNPQPAEATRWLRQAFHDVNAANHQDAHEWTCMHAYQAADKALWANALAKDALSSKPNNIVALCSDSDVLRKRAEKLQSLLGNSCMSIGYPKFSRAIPHTTYTKEIADEAIQIARDLCVEVQFAIDPTRYGKCHFVGETVTNKELKRTIQRKAQKRKCKERLKGFKAKQRRESGNDESSEISTNSDSGNDAVEAKQGKEVEQTEEMAPEEFHGGGSATLGETEYEESNEEKSATLGEAEPEESLGNGTATLGEMEPEESLGNETATLGEMEPEESLGNETATLGEMEPEESHGKESATLGETEPEESHGTESATLGETEPEESHGKESATLGETEPEESHGKESATLRETEPEESHGKESATPGDMEPKESHEKESEGLAEETPGESDRNEDQIP